MAEGTGTTPANGAPATPAPASGGTESGAGALRAARQQLSSVSQERDQLRGEIEQLRVRAETADTLAARVKQLDAELKGKDEQHRTDRALWAAGLTDPDEVELVRFAHGRLPDKDRPALTDWIEQLRKEPTKAPKLLAPVAARWTEASKGTAPASKGTAPAARPRPNARTAPEDDATTTEPTADEWAEARRAALNGNRKPYDELRKRQGRRPGPRR